MHHRSAVSLLILAFFCLVPGRPVQANTTAADEQDSGLRPLLAMSLEELADLEISLATGTAKPLNQAPAVASVITRSDIERVGASSLAEALSGVPGLHVGSMFSHLSPHYSFRGIHTRLNPQVLILVDGQPITFGYNGPKNNIFSMPMAWSIESRWSAAPARRSTGPTPSPG